MSLSQRHSFSRKERERKKEGIGMAIPATGGGVTWRGRATGRRAGESGKVRLAGMTATGENRGLAGQQERSLLAVKPRAHHLQQSLSLGQRSSKDSPGSLDPPVALQRSLLRDAILRLHVSLIQTH